MHICNRVLELELEDYFRFSDVLKIFQRFDINAFEYF